MCGRYAVVSRLKIIEKEFNASISEILDRFEFLYGGDLEHVRRMYNDNDLSSIFKLTDNDELRKAVIEENIHNI